MGEVMLSRSKAVPSAGEGSHTCGASAAEGVLSSLFIFHYCRAMAICDFFGVSLFSFSVKVSALSRCQCLLLCLLFFFSPEVDVLALRSLSLVASHKGLARLFECSLGCFVVYVQLTWAERPCAVDTSVGCWFSFNGAVYSEFAFRRRSATVEFARAERLHWPACWMEVQD